MAKRWIDSGSGPGYVIDVPDYAVSTFDELRDRSLWGRLPDEQAAQMLRFIGDLHDRGLDAGIPFTLEAVKDEHRPR